MSKELVAIERKRNNHPTSQLASDMLAKMETEVPELTRSQMSKEPIKSNVKEKPLAAHSAEELIAVMKEEDANAEREKILQRMTPECRKKLEDIASWFRNEVNHGLRSRYELGLQVKELYEDEKRHGGKIYGKNSIGRICKLFRWDDGLIRMSLRFVQTYSPEDLDRLCTLVLPSGEPLNWSHMRALIPVQDLQRRKELLDKTVTEGLTCIELAQEAKQIMDHPSGDGRGRPPQKPKDFDSAVAQQRKHAEDWDRRHFKVWAANESSVVAQAAKLAPDEVTEERLRLAQELASELRRVADQANDQADKADQVVRDFERILDERKEKGISVEPEEPEDTPRRKNAVKRSSEEVAGKSR